MLICAHRLLIIMAGYASVGVIAILECESSTKCHHCIVLLQYFFTAFATWTCDVCCNVKKRDTSAQ